MTEKEIKSESEDKEKLLEIEELDFNKEEYKAELSKMQADPYNYVLNWMDSVVLYVGRKAFSVLALSPCSLILPNISVGSNKVRSNLNVLIVASPATGKSTIANKFSKITYFPLQRKSISAPELTEKAVEMKLLSLIIEDFSQTAEDYDCIKVMEGICGEEMQASKSNKRGQWLGSAKATALLCGTPTDLEKYSKSLEGGMLSRCMVSFISLSANQHAEVGNYINSKIGNSDYSKKIDLVEKVVLDYYSELLTIQTGKHKIKPIKGFNFEGSGKDIIYKEWNKVSQALIKDLGEYSYIRDLYDAYRIAVASAFLNIHNRSHENGILTPNKEDFQLGLRLMKENMRFKWALMKATILNRNVKSIEALQQWLGSEVSSTVKEILINISHYGQFVKKEDIFK